MNNNNKNKDTLLTSKDVYDLLLKEVEIPSLQSIPLDTYEDIAIALGKIKEQVYEGVEEKIRNRMAELISRSAELLLERRYQKIKEQQNRELSSEISSSSSALSIDYSKLTDEEKYIFDAEKESKKRKCSVLVATLNGRPKVLESISSRIRSKKVVVRFIKPMERFIGIDMTKYGPFQEEDIAILPFENARSLIDNGDAVEINII